MVESVTSGIRAVDPAARSTTPTSFYGGYPPATSDLDHYQQQTWLPLPPQQQNPPPPPPWPPHPPPYHPSYQNPPYYHYPPQPPHQNPNPNPIPATPLSFNPTAPPWLPPSPVYDFHNLDRCTIVLADSTVHSYFALPPDYIDFPPPPQHPRFLPNNSSRNKKEKPQFPKSDTLESPAMATTMVLDPKPVPEAPPASIPSLRSDPDSSSDSEDSDLYTRLKALQRQDEFIDIKTEYVKDEQKNLKREMLRSQEEAKRIQSVPLVIGQFLEMVDENHGIVGSTTVSSHSLTDDEDDQTLTGDDDIRVQVELEESVDVVVEEENLEAETVTHSVDEGEDAAEEKASVVENKLVDEVPAKEVESETVVDELGSAGDDKVDEEITTDPELVKENGDCVVPACDDVKETMSVSRGENNGSCESGGDVAASVGPDSNVEAQVVSGIVDNANGADGLLTRDVKESVPESTVVADRGVDVAEKGDNESCDGNVVDRDKVLKMKRKLGVDPRSGDYREFILDLISDRRISEDKELGQVIVSGNFPIEDDVLNVLMGSVSAMDPGSAMMFFNFMVGKARFPTLLTVSNLCRNLSKHSKADGLLEVFRVLSSGDYFKDLESYNVMVSFLCKAGMVKEAYGVLPEMKKKGISPDLSTYNSLIEACCREDLLRPAKRRWDEMFANGCRGNLKIYNVLIQKFSEVGPADEALKLFIHMLEREVMPDAITYGTLLEGICQETKLQAALEIFDKCVEQDVMLAQSVLGTFILSLYKAGLHLDASRLLCRLSLNVVHSGSHVVLLKCLIGAKEIPVAMEHIKWIRKVSPSMLQTISYELALVSSSQSPVSGPSECLDRLAISSGGNTIVLVASEQLPAFLAAPEWQKHHAALIALAQIAEGCSKVMTKNLEQVVTMVWNSFQDPHPRVRWAAINAIGQLFTDLGPELQVQYHQRVLPALASAMDDFQNPRVQAHAASAVLNFSENCTPDILTPYLDGIVSKVLVLLQNGKQMVKEGALTALASVADSSQEHFQKYYDAVMPYLKAILVNATDKCNRMLRAKAMECISLVGMAVGKEKFRDDAKQVMEVLLSLQGSQMVTDDPTTSYMLQAWARLCKCLGQYFLPYMSVVMPTLLQSAQLKSDVTITSADDISNDQFIQLSIFHLMLVELKGKALDVKVAGMTRERKKHKKKQEQLSFVNEMELAAGGITDELTVNQESLFSFICQARGRACFEGDGIVMNHLMGNISLWMKGTHVMILTNLN